MFSLDLPKLPMDYSLLTKNLLIRRLRESDVMDFHQAKEESFHQLQAWMPWAAQPDEPEQTFRFIAEGILVFQTGHQFRFGGFDKDTGQFILIVDIRKQEHWPGYDMGYWCHSAHAGKGYTTEAVRALTETCFTQLGAERLSIRCAVENTASNRVPEKLGFPLEGLMKNGERHHDGTLRDMNLYAHTPASWAAFTRA
jgi:RimJ/RimL family protein N-acetyltransferase